MHLPFNTAISILDICCNDILAKIQSDLCPNPYLKRLVRIAVNWKQPKHLLIADWLNEPGLAKFFYKRPNSKHFRLCGHLIFIVIFNFTLIVYKQLKTTNELVWLCFNKSLYVDTKI